VQVARLSDYVDGEFDLLKLDVEGAELEVMEDLAARGKLPLIREIIIEVHPALQAGSAMFPRLQQLLAAGGFHWEVRSGSAENGGIFTIHAERTAAGVEAREESNVAAEGPATV
jgi:Methyltransferase FkbM domain